MSWQNKPQPGWAPEGQPLMTPPGPGMAIAPYPAALPPKPGVPAGPPGADLAPPEYPYAPPTASQAAPPYAPPYSPPGAPCPPPGASYPPPGAPYAQPGVSYPPPGAPYSQPGAPYPQPGAPAAAPPGGWPMPNSNCPPGLEYLMALDTLFVDQKVELMEAFTGWETANRYVVKDLRAEPILYASEESNACSRQCCGDSRPFDMKIVDRRMQEVIRLSRPLKCESCFFPCCLQEIEVFSNGLKIGCVNQNWSPFYPSFSVCNSMGDEVLQIKGPICMCTCFCNDVDFNIFSANGEREVGRISKKWSGFSREVFTDADVFGISFPQDLDVKIKAVLLGACFLIDFMYFEGRQKAA